MKFAKDFGIRAWFGTLIIANFCGLFWWALIYRPQALGAIKDAFTGITMAVVAFYFGYKSAKNNGGV